MQSRRGAIARGAFLPRLWYVLFTKTDVSHLVPHERRFGLSAFACSAWPRSSPLVLNTPTPTPSGTPSVPCAWVLTAEISESLHPALGRIPCCKKHKSTQAWRTQVVAEGDTASELVSLRVRASAICAACTAVAPEHRCGFSPHGIGRVVCGSRGKFNRQMCPQLASD